MDNKRQNTNEYGNRQNRQSEYDGLYTVTRDIGITLQHQVLIHKIKIYIIHIKIIHTIAYVFYYKKYVLKLI